MALMQAATDGVQSAVGAKAEDLVLHVLLQLMLILAVTRVVVVGARRLGQTDVAGEILAGLLLGPSCLGALAPELMGRIFASGTNGVFVGLAQLGLLLLMFQIGLSFELKAQLGRAKHTVVAVSFAGIAVPFVLGYLAAPWVLAHLPPGPQPPLLGFRLFFAVALSITAIPILGRIFLELGLAETRVAALTIGAAAIDDVIGWLLLGVVTLVAQARFEATDLLIRTALLLIYVVVVLRFVRPALKRVVAGHLRRHGGLTSAGVAALLLALFISGALTSLLGVFAIIGGFLLGVALHDDRAFVAQWRLRVTPLVETLFLPVFFAYTGLRTDIGGLADLGAWGLCLAVCLLAFVAKFCGCCLAARVSGESWRDAVAVGVCMNTRALMELVALNVGYDLGVIPRSLFTMLVLMAIASTFVATPLIRRLLRPAPRHIEKEARLTPGLQWSPKPRPGA